MWGYQNEIEVLSGAGIDAAGDAGEGGTGNQRCRRDARSDAAGNAEMIHDGFFVGQYADKIRKVVVADLERSGLFKVLPQNSYIQEFTSMDQEPAFVDWRAINAHALVQSSVRELDDKNLRVEFRLWDVPAESQMKGQSFTTTKSNWRRVAHVIADAIYERLTGEKGYFDTRVVYVSETGPATRRVKRLAIMDQDGENHKFLTSGAAMALTPRFSPNLQKITYMSYSGGVPKVYILDIENGRQQLIGNFPGMTFAPRFFSRQQQASVELCFRRTDQYF